MKTKIFCDSANFQIIKKFNNNSLVSGFTTNPSLMRLSGAKNYKNYSLKLLKVCKKKPISLEVFGDSFEEMLTQAMIINSWGKNVYVKIPVVNSRGLFSGKVIRRLSEKGVKLNITAVYTVNQVKKILKSINKNSKTIISIFSGRYPDGLPAFGSGNSLSGIPSPRQNSSTAKVCTIVPRISTYSSGFRPWSFNPSNQFLVMRAESVTIRCTISTIVLDSSPDAVW